MYYETSIEIAAPIEKVWAVLTDIERWPEWTASVTHIERLTPAKLESGSRVRIKQPRLPELEWEVIALEPGRSFSWKASSPGLTSIGDHRLAVAPSGQVSVKLSIQQSGVLAGIVGLLTGKMTREYVNLEAQGLKRRCEGG